MNELNHSNHSKRIATNTLVLFARMLIITIVNLYTVRWVLKGLGTEDYGIYNAVAGVVTTGTCISSVLAMATQRFYSYAIGLGEKEKLTRIFSASVNLVIVFSIITILVLELVGNWFVSTQMTIPADRLSAACWVFQFSIFSFIFTLLQIPYIGAIFSNEDMGVYALVSSVDCFIKLLIAALICMFGFDHLILYSGAMMMESGSMMVVYMLIASRKYIECRYTTKGIDKELYKELISFSGWTFYGALSGMGMTQGNIILLNIFFGPLVNAAFCIGNQLYNAINTLSNSIVVAFRPTLIKSYSCQDMPYIQQLYFSANKAILYLLCLVAMPLMLETENVLQFWLGYSTPEIILFCRLYIIYTIVLTLHNPITIIIQATGKIRKYSLYVESFTIMNIPVCWGLFILDCPSYTIFIVMIVLCLIAHNIRLVMLRKAVPELKLRSYYKHLILPAFFILGITSMLELFLLQLPIAGFQRFGLIVISSVMVMSILIYVWGFSEAERKLLHSLIHKVVNKRQTVL